LSSIEHSAATVVTVGDTVFDILGAFFVFSFAVSGLPRRFAEAFAFGSLLSSIAAILLILSLYQLPQ
jgi:hypothetical protein